MHKKILVAALLLLLWGSGCGRASRESASQELQISLTAVPFPAVVGESRLVIHVRDSEGNPVNDATLAIKGDMTHAGMAPVLAEAQGGGEDGYYNIPYEWTMGGDWVVTVAATLADGRTAQQRFDMEILTADQAAECTVDEPHE